jgi:hypothetical protein
MKRKILLGCIGVVAILLFASFPSGAEPETMRSITKKPSHHTHFLGMSLLRRMIDRLQYVSQHHINDNWTLEELFWAIFFFIGLIIFTTMYFIGFGPESY